ncbi:unnamed protein product, partial [Adineta ricciae]
MLNPIKRMNLCQQCFHIFVTENDILYCSFTDRHQILSKSLLNQWNPLLIVAGTGTQGSTSTTLRFPRGIFIDEINQDLFIADSGNNRIQLFQLNKLTGITKVGNGSLNVTIDLNCPTSIALDKQSYLFIVDSMNNRIIGENQNGFYCLIGCNKSSGINSNQLNQPSSISFDSFGNIFITDRKNNRIQKFNLIIDSNKWIITPYMNLARYYHTSSLLSTGTVFVTGGYYNGYLNNAELYDPLTGKWTRTGSMNSARDLHTASVLSNGKVLVTGGGSNTAELYDPSRGSWTTIGSMNVTRSYHTASVLLNGKVLVAGGSYLNTAELYDPSTGNWTSTGSMNSARYYHTASVLSNGKVLVTGGIYSGYLNTAE